MKARADRDITVGGPVLAAEAIRAGLVDEDHLIVCPVLVGGGKKALPGDVRLRLDLQDERRFGNGVVRPSLPRRELSASRLAAARRRRHRR